LSSRSCRIITIRTEPWRNKVIPNYRYHKRNPREKKKLQCDSLKERTMGYMHPVVSRSYETVSCATAVTEQWLFNLFCAVQAEAIMRASCH
jgi:hypothetical protein